ncbi:hypothetical protein SteCoe_22590 [Stentor coeruleus]|uniref:Uncharacterized protein n=1 Tax=Stentor coeruleus TaxID=5963 RepID=A0A1R2BM01_9CILI|nr:hypothetical protein SteCoe_22590 [Stentor coeruleus]
MGAGPSESETKGANGAIKARRIPELPKNKLPGEILDGFTNYMKLEIERSQEAQKRNRQAYTKAVDRNSISTDAKKNNNPDAHSNQTQPIQEKPLLDSSKNDANNHSNQHEKLSDSVKEDHKHRENTFKEKSENAKESEPRDHTPKNMFRVDSVEREIDEYKNPESPRPAPPVFDENFEVEVVYSKQERVAKEKEALETAQKIAIEQRVKEEKEISEKKKALNQLENKFEDITAKYLK